MALPQRCVIGEDGKRLDPWVFALSAERGESFFFFFYFCLLDDNGDGDGGLI